jgi:cell wall assembly regulator SMI1
MNDNAEWLEKRISYFSDRVLRLYPAAPDEAISNAETRLNCVLSPQYKEFLRIHNGGRIVEVHINGVQLLGSKRIPKEKSIVDRNLEMWSHEWWPKLWLELGTDGFGNYYVADLSHRSEADEYPVLFVDHETLGGDIITSVFAPDYFSFLVKVVDEMIQLYTPEGRLKPTSEDQGL